MRFFIPVLLLAAALAVTAIFLRAASSGAAAPPGCLTGVFLSDSPGWEDLNDFRDDYGRKPSIVMIFTEWGSFVPEKTLRDVYSDNRLLMVTWEPWKASTKEGIDYDGLIAGRYDAYISDFAASLEKIKKDVYIRFAHEANGDWYPWSAAKIGSEKYIAVYRHVRDVFERAAGAVSAKWVFSVNWEDVPRSNSFTRSYPGDAYVDYFGIDGYNWGTSRSWSAWMSFKDIFSARYREITERYKKKVIITEFSSSSSGGDKAAWIKQAFADIKKMTDVKAFILFNVDKETDWSFPPESAAGRELKKALEDPYFR